MTSFIFPFSNKIENNNDRIHQKFVAINSDKDLLFIHCEKNGKTISIGMTRRDYAARKEQIEKGLIFDNSSSYSIS